LKDLADIIFGLRGEELRGGITNFTADRRPGREGLWFGRAD